VASVPATAPRTAVSLPEGRALDFFHSAVAPVISGHLRSDFWTRVVLQVAAQEPAIRHGAIAISSLYEDLNTRQRDGGGGLLAGNAFALQQYNRSIAQLRGVPDEATVLVACVMMICVEFLQGNVHAATEHCRHGIAILNSTETSPWIRDNLLPLFCRLSIFPFLFGSSPAEFPLLDQLEYARLAPPSIVRSVEELQTGMDLIMPKTVRFVRQADEYRSDQTLPIPRDLLAQQLELLTLLDQWDEGLAHFRKTATMTPEDSMGCNIMEMRRLLAYIWVHMALEPDEKAYDRYLAKFQRMVDLATLVIAQSIGRPRPKFLFEMGFLPLMYFVVIKCRDLETRVAALHSLRALSHGRENLWDVDVMYAVGQRIIEMENGVRVDGVPRNEEVREATAEKVSQVLERLVEVHTGEGPNGLGRRVTFIPLRPGEDGEAVIQERVLVMDRTREVSEGRIREVSEEL
jgi:hypothetical protein